MENLREVRKSGFEALTATTELLQRIRSAHPVKGLYEAAELQWWWTRPRPTDKLDQLFWYADGDTAGDGDTAADTDTAENTDARPVAAAILTDFSDGSSAVYGDVTFCPFTLPDASPELIAHVTQSGVALAAEHGYATVDLEVDRTDTTLIAIMNKMGFAVSEESAITQGWLSIADRPEPSQLPDGYRLTSRAETKPHRPHHLAERSESFSEERLEQLSCYRPELDLVILSPDDDYASYILFWYDSTTATGVVEPVRTHDAHQRKGLSRHLLTVGIERLAQAGAERVSIGWEPSNPASGNLYRSVGFIPATTNDLYAGPTGQSSSL